MIVTYTYVNSIRQLCAIELFNNLPINIPNAKAIRLKFILANTLFTHKNGRQNERNDFWYTLVNVEKSNLRFESI